MKRLTLIAPEVVEASDSGERPLTGLPAAAAAFLDAGVLGRIAALGLQVDRIERPEPIANPDNIAALGAYNGSIAVTVRQAIAHESAPMLMGGTCSHLPGMIGGLQHRLSRALGNRPPHRIIRLFCTSF